jgi:starch phosphorylase
MRIVHDYLRLIEDNHEPAVPRTYIFSGKAAPGYWAAKQIIKLICSVARVVNRDPRAQGWMKIVFLPDFRVSLAEIIVPAADLSEQISTAGSEASGTGNMKLAMNGALTIGTLDGANIEIRDAVGAENIFIFGLTAAQVEARRRAVAADRIERRPQDPRVRRVLDAIDSGLFTPHDPQLFHWIVTSLVDGGDPYCHLADLPGYLDTQREVDDTFHQPELWTSKAILNVARIGRFSSDRTVAEYARDIWRIGPVR